MVSGIFNSLFPVPSYLRMSSVGLDISDKSIRFLGFKEEKGKLKIDRFAEETLEGGIVVEGKIKDAKKMKEALTRFRKDHDMYFVRVSFPEEQAYLFQMNLPHLKKRELRESILLQLEEYVPLKAPEAVFDYEISGETADGYRLQVTAASETAVESYADIFTESGLLPLSFEVEAEAIARAVVKKDDPGTYMIVDFGQMRTGISVVSGGAVVFTSTIEIGGALVTSAIEKGLAVSREEAVRLKHERGLIRAGEERGQELFSAIITVVGPLRDEINKNYLYWHTHKEGEGKIRPSIQKLFLCGGDSNLRGLPEYIARSMRTDVELSNVWVNVGDFGGHVPEITFRNSLTYATAIGLALADVRP